MLDDLNFLDPIQSDAESSMAAEQPTAAAPSELAAAPDAATIISIASAVAQALPPMYDAEGRKLGHRGVLVMLRARLLRALEARDEAQAQSLRRAVDVAERTWMDRCKTTGYSPEEATKWDQYNAVMAGLRRHHQSGEKA